MLYIAPPWRSRFPKITQTNALLSVGYRPAWVKHNLSLPEPLRLISVSHLWFFIRAKYILADSSSLKNFRLKT